MHRNEDHYAPLKQFLKSVVFLYYFISQLLGNVSLH